MEITISITEGSLMAKLQNHIDNPLDLEEM